MELLQEYGIFAYAIAILFGGLTGVKYMPDGIGKKYKFLIFSLIVAVIFILLEVFVQKNFEIENSTKYLLTFCVVAICYQYFIKKIFEKWGIVEPDNEPALKVNVIINEVSVLPSTGAEGEWYHISGDEYWFYRDGSWQSIIGGRPKDRAR
jgi:hypothetical protein